MSEDIPLDHLRGLAEQAGLKLTEEELRRLLPGINRARKQTLELRGLVSDALEPAVTFSAATGEKS